MSGADVLDPLPAARRRVFSYGMPQLPLQSAHSRDGQLPGKSDTWYSARKALCSPHEFYRQYSEAGIGPRSSNDKSVNNRNEYPQFSGSASQYTPTGAPNSQLASVPATPSLSATPSVSQDTPHATGSASLMQPSPHGAPAHPHSQSSLGAVSGHPSPGHHSPFDSNSPITASQAWQLAQRNHRSPLQHASPAAASPHVDDSPRPASAYPNPENPADCAALSTLDSYTCLPLPPAGQNPSGSMPSPLFQGSPYLSHAFSQSPSSGALSTGGGGGSYALQGRHVPGQPRARMTAPGGPAAPVSTGPHAVAEAMPHGNASAGAPSAQRSAHNPMPQQPYASPNCAQTPEAVARQWFEVCPGKFWNSTEWNSLAQGKWPSSATTPESRTDRNVVSSASFMHMATAGHTAHDSPRDHRQVPPNGRAPRSRSPANVLPMLRRSGDAANRRRPSRQRVTAPAASNKPSERSASAGGPRTASAPSVASGHLGQRRPGRLRSRSSDSTASPQHGTAHVTVGAVSDDTSITDHVTPEVSAVSVHGEATSSAGDGVSSLSGPENSLMLLQSVESAGGAAAVAAAASRSEDAPQRYADAGRATSHSGSRGPRSASASITRTSARRTYHINHTASDGPPLASPPASQHLQTQTASGPSPRPRSIGPTAGVRQKEIPAPLPRLRETAPCIGGGPDSARDTGESDVGGSESISDERRYYGYGGRYHLHDVTERRLSPSVSPAGTSTSRLRGVGPDSRAAAAAATASLTRTRRSSSVRRTPRQMIPGPPDSTQSQDGHAQNVLMRLEAPSSSGLDSARGPAPGRQRSVSNLYSGAYPKTGASSGGIQACTMDALAGAPGSSAASPAAAARNISTPESPYSPGPRALLTRRRRRRRTRPARLESPPAQFSPCMQYRGVPRPESQTSVTPVRTTPNYASAYSTGYPPLSRRTPRNRAGAYGPSSMSSVHSYTSARSSRVPGMDTMDSLVGAGADNVAAALAADTYASAPRDGTRRAAAPRPRRTVLGPQARQGAFTSLPVLPMGTLALRPQSGDGRGGASRGGDYAGGINLDSLLATNNSADGGLLGFLDRAESARIPEPALPFRETISENNGEHRNPKLSGSELYSTLLGSLRESLSRGHNQVVAASAIPSAGGGSLAATSSIAVPSSVSGPVAAEPSASAPVVAASAAKRGASKEPSGRGGLMRRRRRYGPRLSPSALSQVQQSLEQGHHTDSPVVPVHLFLPPVKITAKSRRGTLRPPRPTFAAHPSPEYSKQGRDSKAAAQPLAAPAPPAAPLPPPLLPALSQGTQGTLNTSPGTLEGQASRPLSTPPTFPCGRDSPRTPTQEIGNTNPIGDRSLRRATSGIVKVGAHDSPEVPPAEATHRAARSRSLLRQPSRTKSSAKSSAKRMLATSTMSDASADTAAAAVRATAAAQAAAAQAPVTVLNAAPSRPTSRMWLPCISAPRTIDEGSESVHNGGVTTGAASSASRSQHGGQKGSAASSSSQVASSSGNGQVSLFKWGLRMSCL